MSSLTVDIQMTEPQMRALGRQIEVPRSKLSPLVLTDEKALKSAQERVLSPNLVSPDGQLRPELIPAFQTLASAKSFGLLSYVERGFALETAIYYPEANSTQGGVSLTSTSDSLQLQSPPVMDAVLEIVRQYTGESLLRRVEFEVDLSWIEAWLLFGATDVGRRKVLEGLLTGTGTDLEVMSIEEVHAVLKGDTAGLQWLAPYFNDCLSLSSPTPADTRKGLEQLAERELVQLSGSSLIVSELIRQIVTEFLLVDGHARVRSACIDAAGEALRTDVRAIKGRAGAMMVWSHDETSINLMGVSPAQFMILASSMVENPGDILVEGDEPLQPGARAMSPETLG